MAKADKDDALLQRIRERAADGYAADLENREAALDDLKFAAGEQWPERIKQQREAEGRPCLTIPRVGQFVRQVTGDIRMNKPAISVRPVEDADKQDAEVREGLIRHIEDQSRAQAVYVMAAEDQVRSGTGYFRVTKDYCDGEGFEQDIIIKPVRNPHSVIVDPMADDQTGRDARWMIVYDEMLKAEFVAQYPKATAIGIGEPMDGSTSGEWDWWQTAERIKVAEYWEVSDEEYDAAQLVDGRVVEGDLVEKAEVAGLVAKKRKATRRKVQMWLTNGKEILEGPVAFESRRIPIIRVVGEEIRIGPRRVRHGLVRFLKDSQRMENYWRSAMVERAALAPKAPWVATAKMLEGNESAWVNSATGNPNVLVYKPDQNAPGMKPERVQPAPVEPAMMQQSVLASDDMKAITGIYDAALGARSNETSGKAILARQREGDVGTYVYIDNLSSAISEAGRVILDLIPVTYDARRQIRILGKDSAAAVIAVNGPGVPDLTKGKYDVTVTTGPSFSTRREEARQSMTEFIQAYPPAAPLIGDLIAKNSDWPYADEVAERLSMIAKASMPPDPNQPPPPDPAMMQAEAKAQADAAKFQADMALKQVDLQMAQQEMEFEREKMQAELVKSNMEIQAQQQALQLEQAKAAAEIEKMRLQAMMQREAFEASAREAEFSRAERGQDREMQMAQFGASAGDPNASLASAITAVAGALSKPKKIVRGADGRAEGLA